MGVSDLKKHAHQILNNENEKVEPRTGIEPATSSCLVHLINGVQGCHSTTELPRHTSSGEEILLFDCCGITSSNSISGGRIFQSLLLPLSGIGPVV